MDSPRLLAPGVPPDYYQSILEAEERHWWHLGMRLVTASLLGERLSSPGARILDAGCGTGGFLRWALDAGSPGRVAGVDISSSAIDLARGRVPEAELHVAPLAQIPFPAESFELVVANDVLQHVPEAELAASVRELARVLVPGGTLLARTNGARSMRRERADWRVYDRKTLLAVLESGGFRCERLTYANMLLSCWAALRGGAPAAPTEHGHGIPTAGGSRVRAAVGLRLLKLEALLLRGRRLTLPYGHTLFALATPTK